MLIAESYIKALNEPEQNNKKDVLAAFRYEVREQIKIFRNKALKEKPELLDLANKDAFNVHTDHIISNAYFGIGFFKR